MYDADLIVVGGGPAGLAAAIGARKIGLSVILVEARRPPIDKACGEGLLPDGVAAAKALGLDLSSDCAAPIAGIRFFRGTLKAEARFDPPGYGIRRTVLSSALAAQAADLGVELHWDTSVVACEGNTLRTNHGLLKARWIVAADGERSRLRAYAGLDRAPHTTRYAFRTHYREAGPRRYVEVYWGDACQVYLTPLPGEGLGVAVISGNPHLRVADAIAQFPALHSLQSLPRASNERGASTTMRTLPRVVKGPFALIGDASGSVDAITGEGIGLAFQQALLLQRSLQQGHLLGYQQGHAALCRRVRWMGRLLLACGRRPWLMDWAIRALDASPQLFQWLTSLHVGHSRPSVQVIRTPELRDNR